MQDSSWRRSEVGNFGMRVKFFNAEPNFSVPGCGTDIVLYGPNITLNNLRQHNYFITPGIYIGLRDLHL